MHIPAFWYPMAALYNQHSNKCPINLINKMVRDIFKSPPGGIQIYLITGEIISC